MSLKTDFEMCKTFHNCLFTFETFPYLSNTFTSCMEYHISIGYMV